MTGNIQSAMRTHRTATSPTPKWSREELTFMLQFEDELDEYGQGA